MDRPTNDARPEAASLNESAASDSKPEAASLNEPTASDSKSEAASLNESAASDSKPEAASLNESAASDSKPEAASLNEPEAFSNSFDNTSSTQHMHGSAASFQGPPPNSGSSPNVKWDWHMISTISSVALGIISIVISLTAMSHNQKSVAVLQEQLHVQQETFVRDLPIQFAVSYKLPPSKDVLKEFVAIENTGRIAIVDTVAELNFYFVYPDGTILSIPEVERALNNDPSLLSQIRATNFLMSPVEIHYLLGGRRRFPVPQLSPGEMSVTDINASSNLNALRLAKFLGAEVIARWRIEYKEGISRRQNASYAFIWIHDSKPSQLKDREEFTREDLSTVIGGKQIMTDLMKREETSKEVIFGIEPQQVNPERDQGSSAVRKTN